MRAVQPPCATKKQLKIRRCEKCGLGLLVKHSLLRLSGLYKLSVELHDYGLKPSGTEPVANLTAVAVSRAARVERNST